MKNVTNDDFNGENLAVEDSGGDGSAEEKTGHHHIFDDAFLSACSWDKRLLIPLVNEIFDKNISEQAEIEHSSNEFFRHKKNEDGNDILAKRITDSIVRADGGKFHFECESKKDGKILIRIAEYDMQIAFQDAECDENKVSMELPETAVIFLRNHRAIPGSGEIVYSKGGQSMIHTVNYFEVRKYDLDYLAEKHLYVLFPFYLMRYEHAMKHGTKSKYERIEKEADEIYNRLTEAYNKGILSMKEYEDIMTLCVDVVKELGRDCSMKERLVEIMGNEVFLTAEERGVKKGIEKGIEKGLDYMSQAIKLINKGINTVEELVEQGIPETAACKALSAFNGK